MVIQDPAGNRVRPQVVDNGNCVYSVTYTPESVGNYVIPVKFGGDHVPASPFRVRVAETGDASKVKFVGASGGGLDLKRKYVVFSYYGN